MTVKVLHVLNHSLPHTDGYSIRSASIVRFQREIGLEPVVLTSPHQEPEPTSSLEVIDDVRYYRTLPNGLTKLPVLHEIQAVRHLSRRISEVVREERPEVIHAHSPCIWGYAARTAAHRNRLPFVYEVRSFWEDNLLDEGILSRYSPKYVATRTLETHVMRRADAVVVIAEPMCREILTRAIPGGEAKLFVVPNGVDTRRFREFPTDHELIDRLSLDGALLVGYVGSLFHWEGVDDLIRAVPLIVGRMRNVKVLIVGGGNETSRIKSLIREHNLESNVVFIGHVPQTEVVRFYSILDLVVYPRKPMRTTELVTPLKILEAMAMGKAVLGSDVGGIRELIADGTGFCFRAGDVRDLAAKCVYLLEHAAERRNCGVRAREFVCTDRDWGSVVKGYESVYRFVLDESGCSGSSFL